MGRSPLSRITSGFGAIWGRGKRPLALPQPAAGSSSSSVPGNATSSFTDAPRAVGGCQPIADKFANLEEVQQELRSKGLESSNLIFAVDFTKSNTWNGKITFRNRNLHEVSPDLLNPYQEAIKTIASTLEAFDDDKLYPAYGFGDATTKDRHVFSFYRDDRPCDGLPELLARYEQLAQNVQLSGPSSFAPAVYQAMKVVVDSGFQYHILLIIADGQVTQLGPDVAAIVAASRLPLSIVMVGVGDGPWDQMMEFDDALLDSQFDNFQFVNFMEVMAQTEGQPREMREAAFALQALMEVPDQYQAICTLNLMHARQEADLSQWAPPLPPPDCVPHSRLQQRLDGIASGAPMPPPQFQAPPRAPPPPPFSQPPPQPPLARGFSPPTAPVGPVPHMDEDEFDPFGAAAALNPAFSSPFAEEAVGCPSSLNRGSSAPSTVGPDAMTELMTCPLTLEVMNDPVMAADGRCYERRVIEEWLKRSDKSPMTGDRMEHTNLTPNYALRSAIMEHKQRMPSMAPVHVPAQAPVHVPAQAPKYNYHHPRQQSRAVQDVPFL